MAKVQVLPHPYECKTATPTKTSFETIPNFISFVLLRDYLNSTQTTNYPGIKPVGVAFKLGKRMTNSPSCVHVLHKTLNVVISRCSFAEDDTEMYPNLKRTSRAIVFAD